MLPIPSHTIFHTTACVHTHTHTHTERNICPCLIFSSTFPSAAHFEISLGVCSFIFSTERIRNSCLLFPPLSLLSSAVYILCHHLQKKDSWQCFILILNFTRFINRNNFYIHYVVQNMITLWISMLDQVCIQPQITYLDAFSSIS